MPRPNVRNKLIQAGLEVIHAQGFNGCSVQDITEAAGVPKGSFYNHFESKEALAVEVLNVYKSAGDLAGLADRAKPPLERLRTYFKLASRPFKPSGFKRGCLLGNLSAELSDSSEPVRKALAQRFANWHRTIADVLREGQASGQVNPDIDADQAARFLVTSWQGAQAQMKVSKSGKPIEDFLEVAFMPLRAK